MCIRDRGAAVAAGCCSCCAQPSRVQSYIRSLVPSGENLAFERRKIKRGKRECRPVACPAVCADDHVDDQSTTEMQTNR